MSGGYQAYGEYKASGVEWLGMVPCQWEILHHKYVSLFTKGKNPIVLLDKPLKNTLPYLSMDCLRSNTYDKYALISDDVRIALDGQTLIIWDGSNAGEFVKGKSGILSSTMAAATLIHSLHDQYYWYLCTSFEAEVRRNANGMGIPHVNGDELKKIKFAMPSVLEQRKIAIFLDHETAKIDTLIEKQNQLIELLKEKRQAVISHAVTKGLDPHVPMKDSGVEWLGEVPKHWDVAKLSFRYEVLLGKMLDEKKISGNHLERYLRNTDVQWNKINTLELPLMDFRDEEKKRYSIKKGDLIVCEGGEIGRCAIWMNEYTCFYQKALHRLRPLTHCDSPPFMYYALFNAVHQERFIGGVGKATIAHLPAETFRQFRFSYPPYEEQIKIIKYLDDQTRKFDGLDNILIYQISLLQERRTALISAAVTGKIDVRHWRVPQVATESKMPEATV